ncbi:hypothetical protein ANN_14004, partial [Periplaneta americana]
MAEHVKNHSMVTDIKGAYEKLYNDGNVAPVMNTALNASTSEMFTASTSELDIDIGAPSTSATDAGMVASSTPTAALVSGSSQVCSESVFSLSERAFKNRLKTYIALNLKNHDRELKDILDCIADEMEDILKTNLKEQLALKFNIFVECVFANVHNETIFHNFKSKNDVLDQYSDVRKFVNKQKEKILKEFEEFSMKGSGVELQLITDMTMLLLFEQGIRGGIYQCVTRHAVANDPKSENFDDSKSPSAIYYVDANNLYGFAMSQKLPYGGFEWLSDEEIHHFDLQAINDDSEIGYILEVDIEYPNHLFEKHRDLPFCAEFAKPPGGKHKKLLTTLHSKQHYVAHYKLLQQAVDNGLQIVKIHRVIKFKQSYWLKQYIHLNTELRKNAKNNFEKDFFKLMNNAVFGKTMENVRKRLHFRLVSNDEKLKKLISKPYFLDRVIYAENLMGIHLAQTQILFDKALYVGICILELSKVHMYNFHYSIMKEELGDKLKLCYVDTDSFIYLIETDDLYHDMQNVRDHLDTSVYSPNHILFSSHNKGVLGKCKDEIPNSHIDEFVGLKAKVYALKCSDFEIKKLKGIKKS